MDPSSYHRILDSAIQGEIEANQFYQQVADKVRDGYLKKLFLNLAEEEFKHQRILEAFRNDEHRMIHFARVTDFHLAETMDDVPLSIKMKPADAIALAMKKEESAMQHYSALADASRDEGQKQVFLELAAMERGHKVKLENAFVDIGFPEVW